MCSLLPEEIILNILSRLPVKSLLRFRCVCKSWFKLFSSSDPNFVKIHLNHAIQEKNFSVMFCRVTLYSIDCDNDDDDAVEIDYPFKSSRGYVKILGSCNGLLCVTTDTVNSIICIWNPSTKEYKLISKPPFEINRNIDIAYGFGYDFKIEDYKLVSIARSGSVDVASKAKVYTLGSNSWRNVETSFPFNSLNWEASGVLVNGVLHWKRSNGIESNAPVVIVSFDIADERFQEMTLPKCLHYNSDLVVCAVGGSLCIVANSHKDLNVDVWVMKDYGMLESWTKLFTISQQSGIHYLRPIQSFKNGEILFEAELSGSLKSALVSYDPKHERATRILKVQSILRWWDTVTYVGSLVSLNSGLKWSRSKKRKQ
ncbi:F-box domain [Macleaya cordata]|uniref:F-box domain n=1 Tax=Macleaya cordata TaxID=56857 RepID=A0A200RDT5_MACCD|nr:F-box domain [Macleaya cordata]